MGKNKLAPSSTIFTYWWTSVRFSGPFYFPMPGPADGPPPAPDHDASPTDQPRNPSMQFPRWFSHLAGQSGNDATPDAAIDASVTAKEYYIQAPDDEKWLVNRMLVQLVDEKEMQPAGDYGSIGSALSNGITIWREDADGSKVHDIVASTAPIQVNADWSVYSHDVEVQNWTNATDEAMSARWDFSAAGVPIVLLPGEKIVVYIQDDLSDLTTHKFAFQGISLAYSE